MVRDQNWYGSCYNCGSPEKPRRLRDSEGTYFQCPTCLSEHDNRDALTGAMDGERATAGKFLRRVADGPNQTPDSDQGTI